MQLSPQAYDDAIAAQNDYKVFYNESGRLYKAKTAKNPGHSEMNFPNLDIKRALPDDGTPITREEMITKINHPDFGITLAVLAADNNGEQDEKTTDSGTTSS